MAKIYGALEVAQLEWFTQSPDTRPSAASNTYRVIYASDVKQVQISDGTNWIAFINGSTNQTLAGNITFSGEQIFTGLHRLSVTTDSSSTGAITALNNTTPVIEFTAAVTSISGIANSASGATVMLVNRTGGTVAVLDEDTGATAANRIRTGTGAQISLANNASILLTYVGDSRWHVIGGSGSGSGSAGINYITNGSAEADTLGWATYAESDAVTFQDTGDTVTLNSHGLSNGNQISFTSITSTTGISTNTLYFVVTATTNTFQVATSLGGSALPLTTNGSGTLVRFVPKTGSGGSSSLSISRSISSPLIGTASFILTKGGLANLEGQGWEYDFTIDRGYQAKVLQISFQYLVNSGTFVAGSSSTVSDVTVYIYDVTNAQIIQPSSFKLLSNNASISDTFNATFQTASNSTAYRLIFHVSTPSTANYELKVDGISVSPSTYVYGTPVTDWQAYTPTFTNLGLVTGTDFKWRRVGNILEIIGYGKSATVASNQRFTLPAGLNIDTSVAGVSATNTLGFFNRLPAAAGSTVTTGGLFYDSALGTQVLRLQTRSDTGLYETTATSAISNNEGFSCRAFVPIQGWSSSVQTSDQTDTRVVSFSAFRTATQSVTADVTDVLFAQINKDSHGAFSGNNTYTIPVAGDYTISASIGDNAAASIGIRLYVSTVQYRTLCFTPAGQNGSGTIIVPNLKVGDTITIRSSVTLTLSVGGYLSIQRISGPSAIAASETVAASYWAGASGTSTSTTPINFSSKEYDTHNAVTTGASWRFTAPISGIYAVNVWVNITGAIATFLYIYKNSTTTDYKTIAYSNTSIAQAMGASALRLNAGDYIAIHTSASVGYDGNASLAGEPTNINIVRVGN